MNTARARRICIIKTLLLANDASASVTAVSGRVRCARQTGIGNNVISAHYVCVGVWLRPWHRLTDEYFLIWTPTLEQNVYVPGHAGRLNLEA